MWYPPGVATSEAELDKMRRNLEVRAIRRAQALALRLHKARADFDRIVRHLVETYRPTRIYQWGSLLDEAHFTERSDIDLAVEGTFTAEQFFAMLRDACGMTRLAVDLVEIRKVHPAFAESIRERGRVVYER